MIPVLPKPQLLAQWREAQLIINGELEDKPVHHILIDYIYSCPKKDLAIYTYIVLQEMRNRNWKIGNETFDRFESYYKSVGFEAYDLSGISENNFSSTFLKYQNNRYFMQCFYNLQEKYDRGQEGFYAEDYNNLVLLKERIIY